MSFELIRQSFRTGYPQFIIVWTQRYFILVFCFFLLIRTLRIFVDCTFFFMTVNTDRLRLNIQKNSLKLSCLVIFCYAKQEIEQEIGKKDEFLSIKLEKLNFPGATGRWAALMCPEPEKFCDCLFDPFIVRNLKAWGSFLTKEEKGGSEPKKGPTNKNLTIVNFTVPRFSREILFSHVSNSKSYRKWSKSAEIVRMAWSR